MGRKWLNVASVCLASGVLVTGTQEAWGNGVLVAAKTATAPKLDGVVDALWGKGKALTIPVMGGKNLPGGKANVTVKALYTDTMVYFLAQYKDSTQSLMRHPWQKQADGSWKKLKTANAEDDENKYYEDRLALLWNISTPGFETQGCTVACHTGETGKAYGNKYTPKAGQTLDLWHIKGVRTAPVGQGDDQYVDSTRFNKDSSPDAGRKSDPKTSGGYSNNENPSKTMPMYALLGNKVAPPYWLLDAKKAPFDNARYKAGDKVPSIIVAPAKGDRGDIAAKMLWKNGVWTYEFARKRVTGSKFDVQFNNLAKSYAFGVSVFDNAEVRHARDVGVEKLTFQK
jgi:hypothetical protein